MTQITTTTVKIDLTNNTVDQDAVVLSKSHGDEVEWSSPKGNAKVIFPDLDPKQPLHNGTPFRTDKPFEVPENKTTGSGPLMDKEKLQICEECTPTQY